MLKTEIIITANYGQLKAYRIEQKSLVHRRAAELIRKTTYEAAHRKLSDLLTDHAGRFPSSGIAGSKDRSFGEEHHLMDDIHNKAVKIIAHDIDGIISHVPANSIYLALPKRLSKEVLAKVSARSRSKITRSIESDIVKEPVDTIRSRFKV